MNKILVIINEQHELLEEQKTILNKEYGTSWEIFNVPAEGWTLPQMNDYILPHLLKADTIVFASPIPYLIMKLSQLSGYYSAHIGLQVEHEHVPCVRIFHN